MTPNDPPMPAPEQPAPSAPTPNVQPSGEQASAPAPAAATAAPGEATSGNGEGEHKEANGEAHGAANASAPGEGGEKKKRRRRRRKKKGDGANAAAGGEGGAPASERGEGEEGEDGPASESSEAAAGGAEEGKPEGGEKSGDRKKKKKKKRPDAPPRERPAFNVSDVVFGKIVEVSDDVIFVDLSGKAKAIFDKLELVLPEDSIDVEDEARRSEELAESIVAGTVEPDAAQHGAAAAAAAAAAAPTGEAKAESIEPPPPSIGTEADGSSPRGKVIRIVRPQQQAEEPAAAPAGEAAAAPAEAAAAAAAAEGAAAAPSAEAAPDAAAPAESEAAAAAAPAEPAPPPPPAEEPKPAVLQLPRVVLEPGAPFVGVVRNDGSRGGLVVLTHHPHRASKTKPLVAAAFKSKSEIMGLVTGVIKGGVEVDIDGVRAFAPGSQMELRLGADLSKLVGRRLNFLVTHYAKRGRDVIVSRRSMLEAEAKVAREEALAKLKVGEVVEGVVRSVVEFGAFIDLGGVDGLVPKTEMSHNRGDRPRDVFKVGEKIPVLVQRIDDRGKISLSRKATLPDPWGDAKQKYAVGSKHSGKVVRIKDFGAFVELERGIDGLIHTADLSFKRIENPEEVVKVGDTLDVIVSSLDSGEHKIGLHPALTGAMAEEPAQRVEVGKNVKAIVVAVESGGLVMRIMGVTGRSARAFMPASLTGTPRGTELRKEFPPGKILDAKVAEKDPRRGEVKLSLKAIQQETERNAYQQYRQQVKREAKFGTFADLLAKKQQK